MQITLNQKEIETAIINFVGSQGISITGKHVDVTLVAGRGPTGMSASIDISNGTSAPTKTTDKPTKQKEQQEELPFDMDETEAVEPERHTEEDEDKPLFGV